MKARSGALLGAVIVVLLTSGCVSSTTSASAPDGEWEPLPAGALVDYQLGGGYPPPDGVGAVVRDSTDESEPGMYSVCYINAFQTQPADRDVWLDERADLVLMTETDEPVVDEEWPDELLLDTSTADKRERIVEHLLRDIRRCHASGFAAVEFDNLDSYSRSGDRLTVDAAIDLARRLVEATHSAGLAAAQKNSVDLAERGRAEAGFDFAIVEQCHEFDECASLKAVYGDAVVDIEYGDAVAFEQACADPDRATSTIRRDRDLTTPDSPDYVFEACR